MPSRVGRISQRCFDLDMGLGHNHRVEAEASATEPRRETKAEREARRLERDRVNREKERVRSMQEESVDGGFLVTQGVVHGTGGLQQTRRTAVDGSEHETQ